MGIETVILVVGVIVAVAITVAVAKSRRRIDLGGPTDEDPRVKPPASPAPRPRE